MKLKISEDLALPLEAVTEKFAFLGRTGSGKTYAAQKLAEEMHRAKAQFVVLDPVGVWYGLRLAADGKAPGLDVPVLGGLRGDIPLEPNAGALIANLVVDRGASMILDVSQFESDAAKARFAHDFADRFFFRKKSAPSPVHLFIDEAQEFCPQNPQREEGRMLHVFTRLLKLGRNFGIGASLLSQRPQEVNKKTLNLAEVLFAFQLTGPQERKTIEGWIGDKGIDGEDIAGELPKLKIGQPHVWSPAWLQISRVITIAPKWTFDASSTPKAGNVAASRDLAPIDLADLQTKMAATIEKAKAEDPKELRKQIADLQKQLRERPAETVETIVEKIIEVPVLKNGQLAKTEKAADRAEQLGQRFLDEAKELRRMIAPAFAPAPTPRPSLPVAAKQALAAPAPPIARPAPRREAVEVGEVKVGKCERAILTALAQYPQGRTVNQIAVLSGYTANGLKNSLSTLRSAGFITREHPIRITVEGLAALGDWTPLPTGPALQQHWLNKLSKCERAILEVLLPEYPNGLSVEQVAEKTNYTVNGLKNSLSTLRTLELITRSHPIRASEDFFQ